MPSAHVQPRTKKPREQVRALPQNCPRGGRLCLPTAGLVHTLETGNDQGREPCTYRCPLARQLAGREADQPTNGRSRPRQPATRHQPTGRHLASRRAGGAVSLAAHDRPGSTHPHRGPRLLYARPDRETGNHRRKSQSRSGRKLRTAVLDLLSSDPLTARTSTRVTISAGRRQPASTRASGR